MTTLLLLCLYTNTHFTTNHSIVMLHTGLCKPSVFGSHREEVCCIALRGRRCWSLLLLVCLKLSTYHLLWLVYPWGLSSRVAPVPYLLGYRCRGLVLVVRLLNEFIVLCHLLLIRYCTFHTQFYNFRLFQFDFELSSLLVLDRNSVIV